MGDLQRESAECRDNRGLGGAGLWRQEQRRPGCSHGPETFDPTIRMFRVDGRFTPNPIRHHLKIRVVMTDRHAIVHSPNTILGIISLDYHITSAPNEVMTTSCTAPVSEVVA